VEEDRVVAEPVGAARRRRDFSLDRPFGGEDDRRPLARYREGQRADDIVRAILAQVEAPRS